jgi:hypothetical protein
MVVTYKEKFNKKYNKGKDVSNSVEAIAKLTGYKLSGLKVIYKKGIGAFNTNPASVRPSVKSPQQWATARLYSAVMGGKAAQVDAKHLVK